MTKPTSFHSQTNVLQFAVILTLYLHGFGVFSLNMGWLPVKRPSLQVDDFFSVAKCYSEWFSFGSVQWVLSNKWAALSNFQASFTQWDGNAIQRTLPRFHLLAPWQHRWASRLQCLQTTGATGSNWEHWPRSVAELGSSLSCHISSFCSTVSRQSFSRGGPCLQPLRYQVSLTLPTPLLYTLSRQHWEVTVLSTAEMQIKEQLFSAQESFCSSTNSWYSWCGRKEATGRKNIHVLKQG